MQISSNDVIFHPLSFADPNGKLFWWNGELYRAIVAERAPLYNAVFDQGIVEQLVQKQLIVDTERTSLVVDGYDLVLKHRIIPFVSYAYEWSAAMLKDAALIVIDLKMELAKHNLGLQDAHPWNVLFDGSKPVYVDFGSIVLAPRAETEWPGYYAFCSFFLYPLLLMAEGYGRIARWLLHDHWEGVRASELEALMPDRGEIRVRLKRASAFAATRKVQLVSGRTRPILTQSLDIVKSTLLRPRNNAKSPSDFLQQLRKTVENIPIREAETDWSNYYDNEFPPFSPSDNWTAKHHSVWHVLSELKPESVLDAASNRGWHSMLASRSGSRVVAFDIDETSITRLYQDSKRDGLSVLPLMMDFRNPSPGYGILNEWLAPATERLRCDMVLALALVHHLVFKQSLNFDQIVRGLSIFSKRWLLVEFVPREDRHVREWWSERFCWYDVENFIEVLKEYFHEVRVLPSAPEPRILLLCER